MKVYNSHEIKNIALLGWTVIRFWGNEIKKRPEFCLKAVEECIMEKKVDAYNVWGFGEDDER